FFDKNLPRAVLPLHRKCASGGFVSSPVCPPTNVLQKYHSSRAKSGTFVSLHLLSPWRQPPRCWPLRPPPIPARPNSSRWRKASIFRSGGIAPTATIGIVGAMTPPSALAQAASPGARDSTAARHYHGPAGGRPHGHP